MSTINLQSIVDYYTNLLIIQYKDKPKAKATVALMVNEMLANGIYFDVQNGFNINTAVGAQLDILGKYIGLNRFFKGQDFPDGIFGFTDYNGSDDGQQGFTDYANYDSETYTTLTYQDIISNNQKLDDDDYRFLLKLKIICNNSSMTHGGIDNAIYTTFGNDLIADTNNDMTMLYFANSNISRLLDVLLQKEVLPRPMGVQLLGIIKQTSPFFGFTTYSQTSTSDNMTGFSIYDDYDTKEGETLTYDKIIT